MASRRSDLEDDIKTLEEFEARYREFLVERRSCERDWSGEEWARRERELKELAPQAEAAMRAAGEKRWDEGPVRIDLPARLLRFVDGGDGIDDTQQWRILEKLPTNIGALKGKLRRAAPGMGLKDTPTYARHHDFERRWPVDSPAELADYADWLVGLVALNAERPPEVKLTLDVYHRSSESIPLDELRERLDEFRFDQLNEAQLVVRDGDALTLTLNLRDHVLGTKSAAIRVVGTDKDRVQAVKTSVKDDGEARTEAARQRVAEAAAKQEAEVEAARQKEAFGIGDPNVARDIIEADAKRHREIERRPRPKPKEPPAPSPATQSPPTEDRTLWQAIKDVDNLVLLVGGFVFAVASGLTVALIVSA